jgi:hypothetical protein
VLGDLASVLQTARAGEGAAERIRAYLVDRAVLAEAADFVVRWANREFSLVTED